MHTPTIVDDSAKPESAANNPSLPLADVSKLAGSTSLDWVKSLSNAVRLNSFNRFETDNSREARKRLVAEVMAANEETRRILAGEITHEDHHKLARVWDKYAKDTAAAMRQRGMRVR